MGRPEGEARTRSLAWTPEWREPLDTHARLTLRAMARGGIHDHVGGGFSRYSVDERWHVPHFEKMLYDNGQLLGSSYAEVWRRAPHPALMQAAEGIVAFGARIERRKRGISIGTRRGQRRRGRHVLRMARRPI